MNSCINEINISDYLKNKGELIEHTLSKLIPENSAPYKILQHSARYCLLNGGKRLRPILALATAASLNGDEQTALHPACALEIIHTYSLIHDDLPCMDNDDYRRGKLTLHKVVPEGIAVLTGDYLLTLAFEVIADAKGLTDSQKINLIKVISKRAGGEGMIAGQVMDVEGENKVLTLDQLQNIHLAKTGALLTASLEIGAIVAHANEEIMHLLQGFGRDIGLAFQIIDDVIDVTASVQKHGKKAASDLTNHKTTYVSILGVNESKELAQRLLESALSKLDCLPGNANVLRNLAKIIVNRSI